MDTLRDHATTFKDRSVTRIKLPPVPAIIPVSKSTWWQGIRDGRFPKAIKIGARTTAWRVEDIRALVERLGR
jgi:predicted DNA-binding transcriptional regulator AlpA